MPKYRVTLSDGRVVTLEAAAPPSEQDVLGALGSESPALEKAAGSTAPSRLTGPRTWGESIRENLPVIGGAVGGFLGGGVGGVVGSIVGPGGILGGGWRGATAGAGIVGAGGEAMRQNIRRMQGLSAPGTPMDAATDIGTEGAIQGAVEGVGAGVGRLLTTAAKPVYNLGLGASKRLRTQHPNLAQVGIDEGVAVSSRGTDKARTLRGQSSQQADTLIADAEQAGAPAVTTNDVIRGGNFRKIADEAGQRAQLGMADDTGDVAARARALHLNNQQGIPLTQAQTLKRTAQQSADTAFRAQERGAVIKGVDAQLDKGTATGLKSAIESRVPAVGPVNQRTQALGGLTKALEDAEKRNHLLSRLVAPAAIGVSSGLTSGDVSTGLGGAALTAGLTMPGNLSRLAIGMDRAGKRGIPAQAIRAALLAMMSSHEKDEP